MESDFLQIKNLVILVRLVTLSIEHTKKPISAVEIDLDYILFFKLPWPGVEPGLQSSQDCVLSTERPEHDF